MEKIKNALISSLLIMSLIPTCVFAAGQVPPSASDKNINIMINGERKILLKKWEALILT